MNIYVLSIIVLITVFSLVHVESNEENSYSDLEKRGRRRWPHIGIRPNINLDFGNNDERSVGSDDLEVSEKSDLNENDQSDSDLEKRRRRPRIGRFRPNINLDFGNNEERSVGSDDLEVSEKSDLNENDLSYSDLEKRRRRRRPHIGIRPNNNLDVGNNEERSNGSDDLEVSEKSELNENDLRENEENDNELRSLESSEQNEQLEQERAISDDIILDDLIENEKKRKGGKKGGKKRKGGKKGKGGVSSNPSIHLNFRENNEEKSMSDEKSISESEYENKELQLRNLPDKNNLKSSIENEKRRRGGRGGKGGLNLLGDILGMFNNNVNKRETDMRNLNLPDVINLESSIENEKRRRGGRGGKGGLNLLGDILGMFNNNDNKRETDMRSSNLPDENNLESSIENEKRRRGGRGGRGGLNNLGDILGLFNNNDNKRETDLRSSNLPDVNNLEISIENEKRRRGGRGGKGGLNLSGDILGMFNNNDNKRETDTRSSNLPDVNNLESSIENEKRRRGGRGGKGGLNLLGDILGLFNNNDNKRETDLRSSNPLSDETAEELNMRGEMDERIENEKKAKGGKGGKGSISLSPNLHLHFRENEGEERELKSLESSDQN